MAPPYDVINPSEIQGYYDRHPNNVVRLILGKKFPDDDEKNNRYIRARDFFKKWLEEGSLIKEDRDTIYGYSEKFTAPSGKVFIRHGFVALMKLEEWGQGGVYPHEKTYPDAKSDRLKLFKATGFNTSFVFSLYSDPEGETREIVKKILNAKEIAHYEDATGVEHIFTKCDDSNVHKLLEDALRDKEVFIADGHHRYETALDYSKELISGGIQGDSHKYIIMYLTPMEGEGVCVLPSHRIVRLPDGFDEASFHTKLNRYFSVETFKVTEMGLHDFTHTLEEKGKGSIGCYFGGDEYLLLTVEDRHNLEVFFPPDMSKELKNLDVSLVRNVLVEGLLGISDPEVSYSKDIEKALKMAEPGKTVTFPINPTVVEEVREISITGERMPQKSTYFYPKVSSGLVFYRLIT